MGTVTIKLPDVGEGVAEAELVAWHAGIGDPVSEDMVIAEVMTDKATVEIPSPVTGTLAWIGGEVGETLAVGSPLARLTVDGPGGTNEVETKAGSPGGDAPGGGKDAGETGGSTGTGPADGPREETDAERSGNTKRSGDGEPDRNEEPEAASSEDEAGRAPRPSSHPSDHLSPGPETRERTISARPAARRPGERPLASPAVRRRAMEAGIDLRRVAGSGPAGRILVDDLDAAIERGPDAGSQGARLADHSVNERRILGLRRKIAERMSLANARIVPITYVDEVDCEALEELRAKLNETRRDDRPKLTLLPFLARAIVIAVAEQPQVNARFDDEAGILHEYGGVHLGIAAQTEGGLVVPVLRHTEARDLWGIGAEIGRLAKAAREGSAKREELSGSTITITSLGALGGIVTTPVINHPEVAIVGVNKMEVRPAWDGTRFVPRRRMNLSSTFDHRVIDGHDAALFVQRLKALLETPALLFVGG